MDQYMVIVEKDSFRQYVRTLYRTTLSLTDDIGEAICCKTLEDAEALRRLVIERYDNISDNVRILKTTLIEEII